MFAIGVDEALAEGDWNYCVHSMECWIETMIKDQGSRIKDQNQGQDQ